MIPVLRVSGLPSLGSTVAAFPAFASSDGLDVDDETGIVVSGAWEERTAHAPFDVAEILLRFLGIWSATLILPPVYPRS